MANQKISQLNSLTNATLDTADVLPVVDTSASETKKITVTNLLNPVDSTFRIVGSSDQTKKVAFEVDGLTTATTRTITIPDASTTLVGTDATQTLTNKTLTSPQINFGSDAAGDIIIRNGSGVTTRLAAGTSGQILNIDNSTGLPAWVANPSAADASTTVKGVSELATLAETLARTTTGGTGAKLVVTPDNLTTVQTYDYAADSVGTDAYAITVTPAPTAYTTGMAFTFKAGTANTGACTLNVNSLGAKTIKKNYTSDTETGDILANQIVTVVYDGTNFQITSPLASALPITYTSNTDGGVTTWDTVSTDFGSSNWTKAGSGLAYSANGAQLIGNSTAHAYATVLGYGTGTGTIDFSNSNWALRMKGSFINQTNTSTTVRMFVGFTTETAATNSSDTTNTTIHRAGVAWYNGALYTVTCNGSAVTATNIATRSGQQWDMITVEFNGTTLTVVLNGVTYTQSTNVPTTGNIKALVGGYHGGGSGTGLSVHGFTFSTKYNA